MAITDTPRCASRAVRAAPTGPSPTTRTSASKPFAAISGLVRAGVVEGTEAFNLDADPVAVLQELHGPHRRPDPAGGAGEDEVARLQGHGLTQVLDLVPHVENQVARVGVLADLAVHQAADRERVGVRNLVGGGDPGAEGRVAVEGLAHDPLRRAVLPGALGGVVAAAVAEDRALGGAP